MKPPNNIQIEPVFGCNRMCSFCGIRGIWKTKEDRIIHFMEMETASAIAKDLGDWIKKKRIEFAMHGEPTLHPNLPTIIGEFRKFCKLSQLQITTNGYAIKRNGVEYIRELFTQGLNILIIDTYLDRELLIEIAKESGIPVDDYYYDSNPLNVYYYHSPEIQRIVLFDDLAVVNRKRVTRVITNHAGNSDEFELSKLGVKPKKLPISKKCVRPFRELVIHYNGTVPICCMDWKHELILGKFPEDGHFWEIWDNRPFSIMRYLLYNKKRIVSCCSRCDFNGGFRQGLLPKVHLEEKEEFLIKEIKNHLNSMFDRGYPNKYANKTLIS